MMYFQPQLNMHFLSLYTIISRFTRSFSLCTRLWSQHRAPFTRQRHSLINCGQKRWQFWPKIASRSSSSHVKLLNANLRIGFVSSLVNFYCILIELYFCPKPEALKYLCIFKPLNFQVVVEFFNFSISDLVKKYFSWMRISSVKITWLLAERFEKCLRSSSVRWQREKVDGKLIHQNNFSRLNVPTLISKQHLHEKYLTSDTSQQAWLKYVRLEDAFAADMQINMKRDESADDLHYCWKCCDGDN